jgi:drug/metabolite transporter (DMT)-like permease
MIALALVSSAFAIARRSSWPHGRQFWYCVKLGLGLFAIPAFLLAFAEGRVPDLGRTALFSLVPVFVVVFEPYIGNSSHTKIALGLPVALLGVVAALLVFPLSIPGSTTSALGFAAIIVATACVASANCLGVALATQMDTPPSAGLAAIAPMAAIANTTGAIGLAAATLLFERPVWTWNRIAPDLLWSTAIDMPALALLYWLMRQMSATRMAARFLLSPLLAILIGVLLLRSVQDLRLRTWLGLFVLAASAAWLLFGPEDKSNSSTLPLNLH